ASSVAPSAVKEVVGLARRHQLLELSQGRRGIGPVEASDRHDRLTCSELDACGAVGSHRGGRPLVAPGVLLDQLDEGSIGRPSVEEPPESPKAFAGAALAPPAPALARPAEGPRRTEATRPAGEGSAGEHLLEELRAGAAL